MSDSNGGEIDKRFAPVENKMYGFMNGAGSPRENALKYEQMSNEQQNLANNMLGGNKKQKKTLKRKWNKKGGNGQVPQTGDTIPVPQFAPVGPPVGGTSTTQISQLANQLKLDAVVAGQNDCHATNSCGQNGGSKHKRNHKHIHKHKKHQTMKKKTQRKPYSISSKRVKLSPFKTINSLKKTLKAYKRGCKIGFTQKSSLRSMGLIPRSNGMYKLGEKY